jgi:sensor histidine kinase regulating citrate/malate metabolism
MDTFFASPEKAEPNELLIEIEAVPEISNRLFQRNFSTKSEAGRGIGTYSMKLFGEKVLGGKVSFTSSEEDGTLFKFSKHLS